VTVTPGSKHPSARLAFAEVGTEPIDVPALTRCAADDAAGAVVTFCGVIRNHDAGQAVDGIDYTAHPKAADVLRQVALEFTGRAGVRAVGIAHRVGALTIGDVALFAIVAADHRREAIATTSDLVDEVKHRVPIWKHQHFSDGHSEWTGLP